jgi:anti-sigma-K factor RskA
MGVSHETFEEAVPQYAIGALDREERERLERHLLTGCATCHAALKEYREAASLLPYGLPASTVPPELRAQVLKTARDAARTASVKGRQLGPEPVDPAGRIITPASRWTRWTPTPAFALTLILLLLGTGTYALFLRSQITSEGEHQEHIEAALQNEAKRIASLQQQITEQERQLAELRTEFTGRTGDLDELRTALADREGQLAQLQKELVEREQEAADLRKTVAQRDEMLTFLKSPHVRVISLAGLERAKEAGALLLFDPDSKKAFFYAFNMPPLPAGKTYQLWAILDKPVSAGTFSTDAGQKSRLILRNLPNFARITQFAVSLEPEGGRPQPTGDLYLSGRL